MWTRRSWFSLRARPPHLQHKHLELESSLPTLESCFCQRPSGRLTLNQKLSCGGGSSAAVGGGHRVRPRILWEGLGDQQTVQVSVLEDLEVGGALDLSSFSVKLDGGAGDSRDSHVQPHLAALPHGGALQPLDKVWRRSLGCRDTHGQQRSGFRHETQVERPKLRLPVKGSYAAAADLYRV